MILHQFLDPDMILKSGDFFNVKRLVKISDLFTARVHLGHHEGCWNTHMKQFIYGTRAHHHIIDLDKTVKHFQVYSVYNNRIFLFKLCLLGNIYTVKFKHF